MHRNIKKKSIRSIIFVCLITVGIVGFKTFIYKDTTEKNPKQLTTEVNLLDGSKKKMNLKVQNLESFNVGDKVYTEYENNIFDEGIVVAKSGDKLEIKGDSIFNNGEKVMTSPKLAETNTLDLFGYATEKEHIACQYRGDGKIIKYDKCFEYITNDTDGSLQMIPEYSIEGASSKNQYVYIEEK